jgi:tetratricopeptide (TPR) repeat protein
MYYYGRGRVYMLAGKIDKAMEDFKRAARLDDEDAQTYLQFQSSNQ